MKNYTPPFVETRLERAGLFRWWITVKAGYQTQKQMVYGSRRAAQRKLERMRYDVRHRQLRRELEES